MAGTPELLASFVGAINSGATSGQSLPYNTALYPNYTAFAFICLQSSGYISATIPVSATQTQVLNQVGQIVNVPDNFLGMIAITGEAKGLYRTISFDLYGVAKETPSATPCTAPTTVWLTDTIVMEGTTTLNWSGAGNGTGSTDYLINNYLVQYRDVDAGGQAGAWTDLQSVPVQSGTTSGSCTVSPPSTHGSHREFRVKAKCLSETYDSDFSAAPYPALYSNPVPTTPTNLQISPTLFESGNISLSWSPSTDTTNRVAGYNLQARTRSSSSASWGEWGDVTAQIDIGVQTVSTVCSPALDRGAQIQYRVCAYDDYNAYGAYAVFTEVTRNSAPTPPTNFRASVSVWESGDITLSWNASTDADGNLDHYSIVYQKSSDGETWDAGTSYTASNTSYVFTPPSGIARGDYLKFTLTAVDALGAESSAVTVTVRKNRAPSSVAGKTIAPLVYETGNITLSWTASTDPDGGVDHYALQYRVRAEDESYGSTWTNDGNVTGTTVSKAPQLDRGSYIQYRIRAVDIYGAASSWGQFTEVQRNTQMGAPTNLSVSPALFENDTISVSWSAPAGDKAVDHYEIAYSVSSNGFTWGSPVTLVSSTEDTTYSVASSVFGVSRGQYVRIMVRSFDEYGVDSSWATANTRKNSVPTAPASLSFPAGTLFFENMPVSVTFPAGTDVDGNLASYDIALMVGNTEAAVMAATPASGDIVATQQHSAGTASYTVSVSRTTQRGQYIRAAVRSVDTFGVVSGWVYTQNAMEHNVLPRPPVMMFPGDDDPPAVSLSKDPIFGIFPVSGSELKTLTYEVKITQGATTVCDWKQVLVDYPGAPAVIRGFRCGLNLSPGNYSIKPRVSDGLGSSVEGNAVDFTVAAPSWGREIQSGSIISSNGFYTKNGSLIMPEGTTVTEEVMDTTEDISVENEVMFMTSSISHQADLRELLQVTNARRAWFSLAGIEYSTEVGYFANWLPQMQQLCIALSMCYWNADEPGMDIPIMPGSNYPRADIINAIRALAENL